MAERGWGGSHRGARGSAKYVGTGSGAGSGRGSTHSRAGERAPQCGWPPATTPHLSLPCSLRLKRSTGAGVDGVPRCGFKGIRSAGRHSVPGGWGKEGGRDGQEARRAGRLKMALLARGACGRKGALVHRIAQRSNWQQPWAPAITTVPSSCHHLRDTPNTITATINSTVTESTNHH